MRFFVFILFVTIVCNSNSWANSNRPCWPVRLLGENSKLLGAASTLGILKGETRHPHLEWFDFDTVNHKGDPIQVRIPFVDLGAQPFRKKLVSDDDRMFQPDILEGQGFSRMVKGQDMLTKLPRWVQRWIARNSFIMRGYVLSENEYFADMPTYFLRLGNEVQPKMMDRLVARDKLSNYILERTREISDAGSKALAEKIQERPERPIRLFSIGGGPMTDTVNMLLTLNRTRPDLVKQLRERQTPIRITIADVSDVGAQFGRRVIERLMEDGKALNGLNIEVEYRPYDWNNSDSLKGDYARWKADDEFVVIHSEGAIGEYATDSVLQGHLGLFRKALPKDTTFIASAFLPDAEFEKMKSDKGFDQIDVHPRNTQTVDELARAAGWSREKEKTVNILDQTFVFVLKQDDGAP